MFIILLIILLLITIGCFSEGKTERKEVKITLSIALSFMLSIIMEASAHSLVNNGIIEGLLLIILYYALPIIFFLSFQLLLYEIRIY